MTLKIMILEIAILKTKNNVNKDKEKKYHSVLNIMRLKSISHLRKMTPNILQRTSFFDYFTVY
uniref:Predicted protein n=1 Tax=Hordeum vulgare subsp. vulgare TaxID=112509 RepID=F2DIK8_HORVV|nr:predicted protein [Hordeum vulgare subsp. vulgare]